MKEKKKFSGRIISGTGRAAFFTGLDWVREQCREKLGFTPFPGTLNLEIGGENIDINDFMRSESVVELLSPEPDGCGAQIVPIFLEGLSAGLIVPDESVRVHGENVVEIIAPLNLRQALSKGDGDLVSGFAVADNSCKSGVFLRQPAKLEVEAVMLDLDGTIIDSVGIYYEIVDAVLEQLELPRVLPEQIKKANENGTFLWEKLFPEEMFNDNTRLKDEAWAIARKLAPEMFNNRVELLPGAAAMLKQIATGGLPLAVVTATPRQNMPAKLKPLAAAGVLDLLQEIITADDTKRKKPAADPLLECCRRLAVDPEKSVYIGDTLVDIQAGKAAGTGTVGVLSGFDNFAMLQRARPDAIVTGLAELDAVISV